MAKRWIFTILLVIIGVFYSCMGVRPRGPFASLQEQDSIGTQSEAGTSGTAGGAQDSEENEKEQGKFILILKRFIPKRIQESLSEKTEQVLTAWTANESVHGVINVLQSAEFGPLSVSPGNSLNPYDKTHKFISILFLISLWVIVFGKTILSLSIPVICLVIIPIIIIMNIINLWKSKDNSNLHRILISAVVTTLIITVAVPIVMKASILIDDYIFSKNVNETLALLEETKEKAGIIDTDLRSGKKSIAVLQAHNASIKLLSNTAVKDSFSYLLVFTISFILTPVFAGIGLYKLTKFTTKKIMKSR